MTQKIEFNSKPKNKKIIFNDEDDEVSKDAVKSKKKSKKQEKKTTNLPAVPLPSPVKVSSNDKPKKNKKIVFEDKSDDESSQAVAKSAVKSKKNSKKSEKNSSEVQEINDVPSMSIPTPTSIDKPKNKKIVFEDKSDDEEEPTTTTKIERQQTLGELQQHVLNRKKGQSGSAFAGGEESGDVERKWYQVYQDPSDAEIDADIKDHEQQELYNICKSSFDAELPSFTKKNPSDAKWLLTALHKGTSKDRANAGALLVTSNPLGNMSALETLIGFTKLSNKSSPEAVSVLTDLFIEVLLPPHRKLSSLQMRAGDWKALKKLDLNSDQQRKVYAYWYYENELKEHYFDYLKNLQQSIQTGQENNKNSSIIAAAKLLSYSPEKEQMLLTMLINKLGDPVSKIASKALHHLSEVAYKHPNMCSVIVVEAEKLLFRNNISERAQHFALCFLSQIAPSGRPEVCTKLVNICFALFKVLVQKGAVNNRTMQAILRCLQKAILEAKPAEGSTEIMTKDMQDTVYRLVHLADIRISIQTLSLLLQLISAKSEKADRFYNALYKKMLDLNLTSVGTKTAGNFLHILHRAIHIDQNVSRAQAFVKRLLQLSLYMPSQMAAGCLIVVSKVFKLRPDLAKFNEEHMGDGSVAVGVAEDIDLSKFDSDGEEKYDDVDSDGEREEKKPKQAQITFDTTSSWHHLKVLGEDKKAEEKVKDISATKYDPYNRAPAYAGAELSARTELLLLKEHFHPTVQVFAENILNRKKIDYYGDPLRDFSLAHFLERFAFKNPKKLEDNKSEALKSNVPQVQGKNYVPYGARGKPVKSLTRTNCTEDELFIFNYLEKKRLTQVPAKKNDEDDAGDVDDDEFEAYLDSLGGKGAKDEDDDDFGVDYLKEIGGELKEDKKKKKKSKKSAADEDDGEGADIDDDWGDEDMPEAGSDGSDDDGSVDFDGGDDDDDFGSDDDGSISLDGEDGDEDMSGPEGEEDISDNDDDSNDDGDDDDDEDGPPKSKKSRQMSEKQFSSSLKHSSDMNSLFAAADDFAELLEETGKAKGQGTANAVFNKDKSSDKQLKWEEKRRSNSKNQKYGKKFKNFKRK